MNNLSSNVSAIYIFYLPNYISLVAFTPKSLSASVKTIDVA